MNTDTPKTQTTESADCCGMTNSKEMPDPRDMLMHRAQSLRSAADDLETLCKALPVELSEKQKLALYRVASEIHFRA